MEWIIQIGAVILSLLLATVKSLRFQPNGLSDFELSRKLHAGDAAAVAEQQRRAVLPTFRAIQNAKEILLLVVLLWLLFATHSVTVGVWLSLLYLLIAYVIAARGWLAGLAGKLEKILEPHGIKLASTLRPLIGLLAPKRAPQQEAGVASRDELRALIANDTKLLAPDDKARMLGAFDFGSLLVADAMVPAGKIQTVDIKETVGPVLLDRLHKQQHNIYVVVKKDIDHIKGYLYMADLTPLDPELKDVADATRPTVHYLPVNASLTDVLVASLSTGRQLFIAVNDTGATKGLVTLGDTLAMLVGEPLAKTAPVATHPHLQ